MPSLEIYNSTATDWTTFVNNLTAFIIKDDFMKYEDSSSNTGISYSNVKASDNSSIEFTAMSTYYKTSVFKFDEFCNGEAISGAKNVCLMIHAGRKPTNGKYMCSIQCVPLIRHNSYGIALYNDENKLYTMLRYDDTVPDSSSKSAIYSNFRAMKYSADGIKFLSLGNSGEAINISVCTFKSIDDPTVTKNVLIVTDSDGYVSLYDAYSPQPWVVHTTYHNGNNIGKTTSINAYKYSMKGYQSDDLYYFDGAYSMPGEGVSTIGGIKFLKVGNSNFFIKMN